MKLKVKFENEICQDFEFVGEKSDWIDLKAAQDYELNQFEYTLINLGFALQLPDGYEAHIVPRSSTFKNFGILQTNSMGIIDNSYCGDEDYWKLPVIAMRDTVIKKGDRICQFRIIEKMSNIEVEIVNTLGNENRGGFGSTGKN
jgi:probable deoxyuridine 5'-triphosphate nucleotidohydrolase yncF